MDVRLQDGTIITGVPDGTTKAQLAAKLRANGYDLSELASAPTPEVASPQRPGFLGSFMYDGGIGSAIFGGGLVTLLGALAAALVYRLVRGSWRSASDMRQRKWVAIALVIPIFFGVSNIANAALWSWSHPRDLELGLTFLVFWAPLFAGFSYLLAKFLKTRTDTAPKAVTPIATPSTIKPYAVTNAASPNSAANTPSATAYTPSHTDPYKQTGEELLSGNVDAAIWARSLVEGAGNDGAVKAAYVKLRVAQINTAIEVEAARAKAEEESAIWRKLDSY